MEREEEPVEPEMSDLQSEMASVVQRIEDLKSWPGATRAQRRAMNRMARRKGNRDYAALDAALRRDAEVRHAEMGADLKRSLLEGMDPEQAAQFCRAMGWDAA